MGLRIPIPKTPKCDYPSFHPCENNASITWKFENDEKHYCHKHDQLLLLKEKQMNDKCSIVISNYKRLEYLKRTLYSIVNNYWSKPYELVIAEEISEDTPDIIKEIEKYKKVLNYTIITYDMEEVTKKTGLVKFFNNPSYSNNLAFKHTKHNLIFHQGNDTIATFGAYQTLLEDYYNSNNLHTIVYSTTLDVPKSYLNKIGEYGENLYSPVEYDDIFQSVHKQTMVTNYLSLCHRDSWLALNGYDIEYLFGIACEDSKFSLSFRHLPNAKWIFSNALTLHQNHRNQTSTSIGDPKIITEERWKEGCSINSKHYHSTPIEQPPKRGLNETLYGVKEIITNIIQ